MRIIYAGTPSFAVNALQALHETDHDIVMVLTQPDRPKGRGQKVQFSDVKDCALACICQCINPVTLRSEESLQYLKDLKPDLMIVAAYGLILSKDILSIPRLGCVNIHASLLPYYRGASPIFRSLLNGDLTTGITLMQMDEGMDTGPMICQEKETRYIARR